MEKNTLHNEEDSLQQQTGLKFEEETNAILYLELNIIWCWNLEHFQKGEQKYLENFKIWCCRRMEKISWIDRVKMKKYYIKSRVRGIG